MERDTKEELQKAINKHLKDAQFKVTGLSVLEQKVELTLKQKQERDRLGFSAPKHYEAWMIIDDNADLLVGFD